MKSLFCFLAALTISCYTMPSNPASESRNNSSTITVEALHICEQDDGDQYFEVAVQQNDGPGLTMYVVRRNVDDSSAKIQKTIDATVLFVGDETQYIDKNDTTKLTVKQNAAGKLVGIFSQLNDGPGGKFLQDLECYKDEKRTYQLM